MSYGFDPAKSGISTSESDSPKNSFYHRTFYPSVTDEKDAAIVEVNVGETAQNIDIKISGKGDTYKFKGILLDDETGKPFTEKRATLFIVAAEKESNGGSTRSEIRENGSFEIGGFLPGTYFIRPFFFPMDGSEYYITPTKFKIVDKNLENFEIRAKKGLSVSGKILLEDKSGGQMPVNLSDVKLWMLGEQFNSANFSSVKYPEMTPEGEFKFLGLRPGEVQILLTNRISGLKIAKYIRDGRILEKIVVPESNSIDNLQIYTVYGNVNLQGQINFESGAVPNGSEIRVIAKPTEQGRVDRVVTRADERGKFLLEGLTPEEYEISVYIAESRKSLYTMPEKIIAKSRITLVNGVTGQIGFDINLDQTK